MYLFQVCGLDHRGFPPPVIIFNRCPATDCANGMSFYVNAFGKLPIGQRAVSYTLVAIVFYIGTSRMKHYTCRVLGGEHALAVDPAIDPITDVDDVVMLDGKPLHWWSVDSLNGCGVPMLGTPNRWFWTPKDLTQPVLMMYVKNSLLRSPN